MKGAAMIPRIEPAIPPAKAKAVQLLDCIINRELSCQPKEKKPHRCPHCGELELTKRGYDAYGKQRYSCKRCRRSFTSLTGRAFSSTNMPIGTWLAFSKCYIGGLTLRDSATICGVSLKTAFNMRRRLVATIHEYSHQVKQLKQMTSTARKDISTL